MRKFVEPMKWCTVVALGLTSPASFAQANGEEWEYTMTVEMEGMQMPLPPSKVCVKPDEGHTPPVDKHCKLKDRKISGATTTFHIVCGPPEPAELKGKFTLKGDSVEGLYTVTQEGEITTVVAVGKKLGDCDPSKPALPEAKK